MARAWCGLLEDQWGPEEQSRPQRPHVLLLRICHHTEVHTQKPENMRDSPKQQIDTHPRPENTFSQRVVICEPSFSQGQNSELSGKGHSLPAVLLTQSAHSGDRLSEVDVCHLHEGMT